ncbi:A/B/D/E cyclin [Lipomyces arxii]|uniref:A/B/D/E cyclin n=1 Tax=Lipomyces arxii TaxID=56418 RepID=UPI0034CDEEE4
MDRKLRQPLRVRPDENAMVSRQQQSGRVPIKQVAGPLIANNKVGLKAGAKRVVLGDVSNSVKPTAPIGGKLVQQKTSRNLQPTSRQQNVTNIPYLDSSRDHHVATEDIVEVYNRVRKNRERKDMAEDVAVVLSSTKVSDDLDDFDNEDEEEEEDDDDDAMADNTSASLLQNSNSILNNLDSTEYTNFNSTTNANALFPLVNADTRREFDILAAEFHKQEYARTLTPEHESDEDLYDVSMVAEYSEEIFTYMRELEIRFRPDPAYMDNQTEVHWPMRAILVDWLVQVHNRFGLLPETLFLTINYIDRFLSLKVVSLAKLQLVGATALFVAAKYEEINCPSVQEIVFMVDHSYTAEEVFKAERFMIGLLEFNLGWPGPMSFLRRTSKADDYDLETRTLAKYILEVTITDQRFVGALPSWLAAAAHCLSRKMLLKGDWTLAHVFYSGYTLDQLRPAVNVLIECCRNPKVHHKAVYEKYCDRKYKKAALFVEEWISSVSV